MIKIQKSALLLFFTICLTSSAIGGGDTKPLNNGSVWIPSDFDARKSILLVEEFKFHNRYKGDEGPKVTEEMKNEMKAHYPFKYEFATQDEIENADKYADKVKYRYALVWTHYNGAFDFYILDRKTDNPFPVTGKFSSFVMTIFKPVVATIVEYLQSLK